MGKKYPEDLKILERKLTDSIKSIQKMLELSDNSYIALSFGKDSLVMMDMIYRLQPGVKCLFLKSEETFLMYNYEEVINSYKETHNLNLEIVETFRLTEHGHDWNKARKAGNKDFFLDNFKGYSGVFMGLRKEESKNRRRSLSIKKNNIIYKNIMQYKSGIREGMYRCCPVADWTAYEIMFYLKTCGLKYLDVYEQGEHIRTTARITGDAERQNALFYIKKNNPDNWRKIIKILPELKNS